MSDTRITINTRIEWFIGPRRLLRTGTVLDVYASGGYKVRVDGMKTAPIRTVLPSADPRPLATT